MDHSSVSEISQGMSSGEIKSSLYDKKESLAKLRRSTSAKKRDTKIGFETIQDKNLNVAEHSGSHGRKSSKAIQKYYSEERRSIGLQTPDEIPLGKPCEEEDDDEYAIDFSMLQNLPKSVIQDAIEYAKMKRKEDERLEREKQQTKPLVCVPPWAKTYGGERLETSATIGTQYDLPSDTKIDSFDQEPGGYEEGEEESEEEAKGDERSYDFASFTEEMLDDKVAKKGKKWKQHEKVHKIKDKTEPYESGENIGLQIEPEMVTFGIQTGQSLLDTNEEQIEEPWKVKSEILKSPTSFVEQIISDEEKILLQPSEFSVLPSEERLQYVATLTSEEKLGLGLEVSVISDKSLTDKATEKPVGKQKKIKPKVAKGIKEEVEIGGIYGDVEEGKEEIEEEECRELEEKLETEGEGESFEGGLLEDELYMPEIKKVQKPGKDSEYLKHHLGAILPKILAEIAWKQPPDPVHYLAHRLYCERRHQQMRTQLVCMKASLKQEREIQSAAGELAIKTFGFVDRTRDSLKITDDYDRLQLEEEEDEDTIGEAVADEQYFPEEIE